MAQAGGTANMTSGWMKALGLGTRNSGLSREKFNYQKSKDAAEQAQKDLDRTYQHGQDTISNDLAARTEADRLKQEQIKNANDAAHLGISQKQYELEMKAGERAAEQLGLTKQEFVFKQHDDARKAEEAARQATELTLKQQTSDIQRWQAAHPYKEPPQLAAPTAPKSPLEPYQSPEAQNQERQVLVNDLASRIPGAITYDAKGDAIVNPEVAAVGDKLKERTFQYLRAGYDVDTSSRAAIKDLYGEHPTLDTQGHWYTGGTTQVLTPDPGIAPTPPPIDASHSPDAWYQKRMNDWRAYEQWRVNQHAPAYPGPDWLKQEAEHPYAPAAPPVVYDPAEPYVPPTLPVPGANAAAPVIAPTPPVVTPPPAPPVVTPPVVTPPPPANASAPTPPVVVQPPPPTPPTPPPAPADQSATAPTPPPDSSTPPDQPKKKPRFSIIEFQ